MKAMIIYMSISHNNTEKVAKALSEALMADLRKANEVDPKTIGDYDLIGIGSGIYNGRHHEDLFNLIEKLSNLNKKAFVFSTAGYATEERVEKYHEPLKAALSAKGFEIIGEFNCPALNTAGIGRIRALNKGRPNEDDLKKAAEFARSLQK